MTYRILCEVSGGPTGHRTSYLKENGIEELFSTKEKAEAVAKKMTETMQSRKYRTANFLYTAEECEHYTSEILSRWTHPSDYGGHSPDGDYMMCGQSRDSNALERSNYKRIFEDLVKKAVELGQPEDDQTDHDEDPKQYVYDFRANHWAVGWVDQVIVKASAPEDLIRYCEEIYQAIENYPVYDEEHCSELETEESNEYWAGMSVRERCDIIKKHAPEVSIFAGRRDYIPDNNGGIDDYLRSD